MTRPRVGRSPIGPTIHLAPLDGWHSRAECRTADPDIFNGPGLDLTAAVAYCDVCPVRRECLDHGRRERADGVYGGRLLAPKKPGSKPRAVLLALGSTDDAVLRKLHSLYVQGRRDELAVAGEREYNTRRRRARREEAAS